MQIKIVQSVRIFKFAVFPPKKGGTSVFGGDIVVTPAKMWFDIVHGRKGKYISGFEEARI